MAERRLSVGVTGHRLDRLGDADPVLLMGAMADVMAALEDAAAIEHRGHLRLITSLADGADSLAADVAQQREWSVDAVLPFERNDYAQDFAEGEPREAYLRRLCACTAAMELPGSRIDGHHETVAYERAGRVLLSQCDILIALWDGGPVRGRGGAAQIVAEAVQQGIAVVHIDPAASHPPVLLWDGLEELALGGDTVDTVARGVLGDLSALVTRLTRNDVAPPSQPAAGRTLAIAYPLLLMLMGVRRMRRADFGGGDGQAAAAAEIAALCPQDGALRGRLAGLLAPRFARADAAATRLAQLFRNGYVANFTAAALAVLLSLMGLALPPSAKPLLIAAELAIIGSILWRTRRGNRAGWHHSWLANRALAERLRCLAVSAQLGDLGLRVGEGHAGWVSHASRAVARALGLANGVITPAYLADVRSALLRLVEGQIAYLTAEAKQMHVLEHRLHRLGTWLFAVTALTCITLLLFKLLGSLLPQYQALAHPAALAATIIGAALPAFGAAIYGIRMQGDFAGATQRGAELAGKLDVLRGAVAAAENFDTLSRCARSATSLLTADVASWLHSVQARPLALPG